MNRKVTRFTVPVDVRYDSERGGQPVAASDAVEDFYRMLREAEEMGLMDRQIIDITYGGPDSPMGKTDAYDADLETEDDEREPQYAAVLRRLVDMSDDEYQYDKIPEVTVDSDEERTSDEDSNA